MDVQWMGDTQFGSCTWCGRNVGMREVGCFIQPERVHSFTIHTGCKRGLLDFLTIGQDAEQAALEIWRTFPLSHYAAWRKTMPKKSKRTVKDYKALLAKAEIVTGKSARKNHSALVGAWYLYTDVEYREGQYGTYAICEVSALDKSGKKVIGQPERVLIGSKVLLEALATFDLPFVAQVKKGETKTGQPFYYFV